MCTSLFIVQHDVPCGYMSCTRRYSCDLPCVITYCSFYLYIIFARISLFFLYMLQFSYINTRTCNVCFINKFLYQNACTLNNEINIFALVHFVCRSECNNYRTKNITAVTLHFVARYKMSLINYSTIVSCISLVCIVALKTATTTSHDRSHVKRDSGKLP